MKYIVSSIASLILNNAPSADGEMMIRVDGFEDIKIYETLARTISKGLEGRNLTSRIKLAKNKWKYFQDNSEESSYLQSMVQNNWVVENKSITDYRNMHDKNVLVLMGTEDEEDKGGFKNFYTITPDILVSELAGDFYSLFMDSIDFSEDDKAVVNKLYKDLFEYIAIDLCKLSDLIDSWEGKITTVNDFIELFYDSLPEWGMPYKRMDLPTAKQVKVKSNILKTEYNFISRQLFKKLSKPQYNKYKEQLEKYENENHEYYSGWNGWSKQAIKGYKAFSDIVMGYIRGENVAEYREKLINTDFSIVEAVLEIKIIKEKKQKYTIPVVYGDPLEAFTNALLQMLCWVKESKCDVATLDFSIKQAEVVSMYSEIDGEEEKQQLQNTWVTICRHTNGVFEYMNKNMWLINDEEINIVHSPQDVFSPKCAMVNIETGLVKAASTNKTISKVDFTVKCRDYEGNIVKDGKKGMMQEFQWKFSGTDAWLHNFADICNLEICNYKDENYIPITTIKKITPLLFAKSEEEFFDLYDESDIRFDFNLTKYVDDNTSGESKIYSAKFDILGKKFANFIYSVANEGFYKCITKEQSELFALVTAYTKLGNELSRICLPENKKWILDAFVHAFNIEETTEVIANDTKARCCIVPTWHPAALEKLNDQKIFFLGGCSEWWNSLNDVPKGFKKQIDETIENLLQMSMIQSSLDIFPSYGQQYFGAVNSFGAFSIYRRSDIENTTKLKDLIHKDAIYDDDFDCKENAKMNDNAKMIYGVLADYNKAFPNAYRNLNVVFIDPTELQPIIASLYRYIEVAKKKHPKDLINICIKILVKPENKGGRNYLAYWMDECFSQDANVNIRVYLNEWKSKTDIDKLLNGNNDIVFVMDLLKVNNLHFVKERKNIQLGYSQCRYPIVFKPSPVSDTSSNVKRRIELSQPQFSGSYAHTQVARYRNNTETIPDSNFIAVREVCIDNGAQSLVYALHEKAYWVVCVDSGMDGALLRSNSQHDEYSIIGFSTGKGSYGQYNLTITARKTILETIQKKLETRLYQLFQWEKTKIDKAATLCLKEAGGLDGISLLSAVNPKDQNIREFMAYVLTSFREKETGSKAALKIVIHLDSYKHWFSGEIEKDDDDSMSRPDFLILEANLSDDEKLQLKSTVTECKMASIAFANQHKANALGQVKHGINRLSTIFNPNSNSIKRRYWYAQLYRALAFAQVTFSDNTAEFAEFSAKLRAVLDGNFEIEWYGKVLGYWLDMDGSNEVMNDTDESCIKIYDIPQRKIQQLLLGESIADTKYVDVNVGLLIDDVDVEQRIVEREKEISEELKSIQKNKKKISQITEIEPVKIVENPKVIVEYQDTLENIEAEKTVEQISKEEITVNSMESQSAKNVEIVSEVEEAKEESQNETLENNFVNESNAVELENTRVIIGIDKVKDKVCWEFGHKQLANRHLLITGTSGQGKTYSIQTMLYELSKSNVSSVIFDYTEGFRLDQLEPEFIGRMENHINQRVVKFENVPINPFKRQYIEFAGMKYPEKDSDVAARFANIMTHVYNLGDQQSAAIFDAVRVGLSKYKDKMNMQHFQEELENEKQVNKSAQSVISKMQPFFYSIEFEEDSNFDWKDVIYPEDSTATIFQLTAIDRDMQVIITELMLWDLWYYTTKNGSKDKPFVVVLDEAQNLSHKEKSPSCKILTEGRKFGWSAWYATQSLKVLDDEEVTRLMQAAFKLYFKPTDDEIVKMAKQLDPTNGNTWLTSIKGLKKGQCIVVGERVRQDGKFGLSKPTITSVTSFGERG